MSAVTESVQLAYEQYTLRVHKTNEERASAIPPLTPIQPLSLIEFLAESMGKMPANTPQPLDIHLRQ